MKVNGPILYLKELSMGRLVLWCYLFWYLVVLVRYFDSNPQIWLTSIGLAIIIGVALYVSSTTGGNKLGHWQTIRLFLMPFFVSSFSALVKGRGFTLVFSPDPRETLFAIAVCAVFCAVVWTLKKKGTSRIRPRGPSESRV